MQNATAALDSPAGSIASICDDNPSLTFALAVLGAILGVVNTWHALDQRRVRVKVSPSYALAVVDGGHTAPAMFMIQVANPSTFPVTVSEIGFQLADGRHAPVIVFRPSRSEIDCLFALIGRTPFRSTSKLRLC